MKLLKAILWGLFLSTQSPYAETFDIASLDAEKEARLQALMAMDMMELQEVEIKLDDVFDIFGALVKKQKISVASGRKENIATAPAVTSLITAQDIEAMGARTLEEALRSVPGLHVTVNGVAYRPMFSMRGMLTISNAEVLIMRNGIPINFPQTRNIGTGWGDMSVNNIARIEVIRGPGSALYGADAFAGVINIITKTAKDIDSTEIGLRYGTFNTKEAWILYGKQGEEAAGFLAELDFSIALELLDTDGLDAMIETDAQTIYDKRFGTQASNAPGPLNLQKQSYNVSVDTSWKGWTLRGNYQQRDKLGTGAGFGTALAPDDVINNKRYLLSLDYQRQLTANWLVKGGLSYQQWNSSNNGIHMFPAGAFGGLYPSGMILKTNTKNKASRGEISILYSGFNQHQVNLGTGINYEDLSKFDYWANFGLNASGNAIPPGSPIINLTGTANAMLRPVSRRNTYLFIQDSWNFMDDWLLTAGLRYDYYSDIGGTANPRLALVYQINPNLTVKGLYGQAFRAPSFQEMNMTSTITMGNPNLKPETIETWELAFDYRVSNNLYLTTNFYTYSAKDKIVLVPSITQNMMIYQNNDTFEGRGLEMEARWKINNKTSLLANYALQYTEDQLGNNIERTPQQSIYLRADRLLASHWFADIQTNWVADRKRSANDVRQEISDYTTIDLTMRYKALEKNGWDFALGVRNMFNSNLREPSTFSSGISGVGIYYDLPLAGREWFGELRYRF